MLSSLSLGSIDNLEKLPINSLNNICDRVRQALLHVFLPRLCEKCQPTFSEAFKKTQSTPLLLKALCEPCKINYVKDKRSVSRKKATLKPEKSEPTISADYNSTTTTDTGTDLITTTKLPAKRKHKMEVSRSLESLNDLNDQRNQESSNFGKLKVKIKLISATKLDATSTNVSSASITDHLNSNITADRLNASIINPLTTSITKSLTTANNLPTTATITVNPLTDNPINHPLPLTPPPTDDDDDNRICKVQVQSLDDNVTIVIDNYEFKQHITRRQIYEYFSEKGVNWCRYCGVAGETGTFWKLGPWGDRTLCHKHGCEFFGCGFARVTKTRLDLTKFYGEKRSDRIKPIISEYCSTCWLKFDENEDYVSCNGCPLAYHKTCLNNHHQSTPFYCTENCHENFEKCLIRPQFHSKSSFPFYRQILTVNTESNNENNNFKIRLQIPKTPIHIISVVKKRKYNHRKQFENQVDRIIPFLPIKVDQTIHQHENIKTPQWSKKSLKERLNQPITSDPHFIVEELDDQILLNRHARYEHVEKTTRLLKPGVLKQLISGQI